MFIDLPGTYTISINSTVNITSLVIGVESGRQTIVSRGNLNVEGSSFLGANGVLNVTGGSLTLR